MDKKGLVIAQIRVTAMVESVFEIDSLQMYVHECVCVCVCVCLGLGEEKSSTNQKQFSAL